MASLVLSGDTSGSVTLAAPAVAGSTTQTLVPATGTLAPLISGTAVTASGTSVDFTDIPSWVKRITVMFSGVSTNGTSIPMLQIGDPGGVEATGYSGNAVVVSSAGTPDSPNSTGVKLYTSMAAAASFSGQCQINNMTGNIWVFSGSIVRSDSSGIGFSSGAKTLSDTLTQIRITTVNGTDTFDAGTINILYE
jgi:hypothetical protein